MEESLFAFQRRAGAHPQQSLRYYREAHAEPLWAGASGRLSGPPPPCPRCGAARTFECQLMPQMLCAIEEFEYWGGGAGDTLEEAKDVLDWGVLAIYTCSASCAKHEDVCAYAEEYCWHQLL